MRAIRKFAEFVGYTLYHGGLDCPVHIKNYRELYQCHADTIGAAIAAVKKQSPEKPEKKPDKICELVQHYFCPECGRYFG